MKDILDHISSWSALKWVIIVLIAGFIGQFGKMLASAIVRKIKMARLKHQGPASEASGEDHELPPANIRNDIGKQPDTSRRPLDKKALKILAKANKKAAKKNK